MSIKPQKKVLFLITKSNWGGAQRYVYDLATTLDPALFEVVVALGGSGELAKKLEVAGIRVLRIGSLQRDLSLKKELLSFWQIARVIRSERPDVLHVNSSKAGGIGACIGRLCRVRAVVYTAHGWAFNESRGRFGRTLVGFFHWLTIMFAHRTITVSHALQTQMHWPFTQAKMQTVRLGRAPIDFKTKDDARQLLEMHVTNMDRGLVDFHDDPWVGTIAELHPIKNLLVAVAAIAALIHAIPSLRYIIIGEGEQRTELTEQIKHLGLEEHVFLVGALPEAARFLPAFDLFVLPSRSEAAGYVLLEAGLAQVPVVATNVGGIPELITNTQTGLLVPADSTDALTAALRTLLADRDAGSDMAATLHATARTFTLAAMTEQTTKLYNELLLNN